MGDELWISGVQSVEKKKKKRTVNNITACDAEYQTTLTIVGMFSKYLLDKSFNDILIDSCLVY